jgi:hypothetical protein
LQGLQQIKSTEKDCAEFHDYDEEGVFDTWIEQSEGEDEEIKEKEEDFDDVDCINCFSVRLQINPLKKAVIRLRKYVFKGIEFDRPSEDTVKCCLFMKKSNQFSDLQ